MSEDMSAPDYDAPPSPIAAKKKPIPPPRPPRRALDYKKRESYHASVVYSCSPNNIPDELKGHSAEMIVKMATVFGIPVERGGQRADSASLCQQLDNSIKKAKLMAQLENVGNTCASGVQNLRKELLALGNDQQDVRVEATISRLEESYNLDRVRDMFEDPDISAANFGKVVALLLTCNKDIATLSNSLRQVRQTNATTAKAVPAPPRTVPASQRVPAATQRGPTDQRSKGQKFIDATSKVQAGVEKGQAAVESGLKAMSWLVQQLESAKQVASKFKK